MLDVEQHAGEIWTLYGRHQLGRTFDPPELDGWAWDIPQAGPGIDTLGNVAGLRDAVDHLRQAAPRHRSPVVRRAGRRRGAWVMPGVSAVQGAATMTA
ncbi:hypothetical protein [Streptomyces vinaceus]|uniref:hypothetical protein n=1 Tax=Streptomyces vinaceus TaxID=1960 RepID=UPI0036BD057B